MKAKSPDSIFTPARCQHRTAAGRQCRSLASDPSSGFCPHHAACLDDDHTDFLAALTQKACRFQNAQGINHSLGALYTLAAQGRISPRRASVLAYISSLLLRSLTAIDNDLYPKAGRPGFSPSGEPIVQDDVDAIDDPGQSDDPTKSQKPN
jgi:hypothetical protein